MLGEMGHKEEIELQSADKEVQICSRVIKANQILHSETGLSGEPGKQVNTVQ